MDNPLFEYVLRLGDDALVNGQRLSEWCGHGPFLEEDVGVANTALDLIGRARLLLSYAGELEGRGRDEDALAFHRDEREWRNLLMTELPRGDFAFTTSRQFLLDSFQYHLYLGLQDSTDPQLAAIAAKVCKEARYHLRHTSEWMLRLGDGTDESHERTLAALQTLWPYIGELFESDPVHEWASENHIGPALAPLREPWDTHVHDILRRAGLPRPDSELALSGGRRGLHTEHMGFLLAEMQFVQRAYPGMQW